MKYAAFLAYPERYSAWAETLRGHLESLLDGRHPAQVFDAKLDLIPGRLRLDGIQTGLEDSAALILVVSPETLCSVELNLQWQAVIKEKPVIVARLVDTPLPGFLESLVDVDFRDHDAEGYRSGLVKLAAALGLGSQRKPVKLPADLVAPCCPTTGIPRQLRARVVEWLAPFAEKDRDRKYLGDSLGLNEGSLDFPTATLAASAALVLGAKAGDPVKELIGLLETLEISFAKDEPEAVAALTEIREELRALTTPTGEAGADPVVEAWWSHVAEKHSRLVTFKLERPAELALLETAWVELEVRPELHGRREGLGAKPELWGKALTIDEALMIEPGTEPWITGRWLVEGEPGSGKTTLLRHLARRLAMSRDAGRIPVFVSLPVLVKSGQGLVEHLTDGFKSREAMVQVLETAGRGGRLVVLLDGLDEVPPERRSGVETRLRQLPHDWPGCRVIVASRPLGQGEVPEGYPKLKLLALERERQLEFLEKWFTFGKVEAPADAAAEAVEHFHGRAALRELAGNPLYLTLLAILWEDGERNLERRVTLYERIFKLLFEGRHKLKGERRPIPAPESVRKALAHLAHGMTEADLPAEPCARLQERLLEPALEEVRGTLSAVSRWRDDWQSFFDEVYERTHILGPHDGEDADWRFWHRTFREALTAEKLESLLAVEGEEALFARVATVEEEEDEGRWAEPFALLAGRLGADADRFILRLTEANGRLGRRALGTAQGLKPETLREMLARCEDWEGRSEVYVQLPEQLETPAACLAFLDDLRRETRDGSDLFFIDHTAGLVGERWREATGEVEAFRARLYNHIPPPEDSELFWSVETPKDGRVDVWCEIPAGEGWVGSPEGVGDADEHPRHRVEIVRSYWLAAVPVTNGQYAAFDPGKAWRPWEGVGDKELRHHPVVNVTWYEAVSFCRWLATLPGLQGARLPTEEEWEVACRAGSETAYWNGDDEEGLAEVGWYNANSGQRTHRVGEKTPNPHGLYDVHGNVWEWTANVRDAERYAGREAGIEVDSAAPSADFAASPGVGRVIRGGSCWGGADGARSACRGWGDPGWGWDWRRGFRVLLPFAPSRR